MTLPPGTDLSALTDGSSNQPRAIDPAVILSRTPLFETLLKEAGLKIAFGDTTCFNHETETLVISMRQLNEIGLTTMRAFDFAVLHEGFHLRELSEDPVGFQKSMKRYDGTPHHGMAFRLHNCTQDIYVNSCIKNECPVYRTAGGDFTDEVKSYYTQHLFKERDFSKISFAQQFTDYLLQIGMGVAHDVTLSPEVKKIFDDGIMDFSGDRVSFKEFIDLHFRPTSCATPTERERITRRSLVAHLKLYPILQELLKLDDEAGRTQAEQKSRSGAAKSSGAPNPGDQSSVGAAEGDATPDNGPGNLPDKVIQDLIKHFTEKKAEREMSPEERRKREQQRQIRAAGSGVGVPPHKTDKFIEVVERVRPFVDQLKDAWDEIQTESSTMLTDVDGPFTRGFSLNLPAAVRDFHNVMNNPSGARVQNRRVPNEVVREFPVELMVRLVIDCSGSMSGQLSEVEAAVVAVGMSLQAKNLEAIDDGRPFTCGLQVVTFQGQGASKEVLPRTHAIRVTDLLRSYGSIHADGGTFDDEALRIVEESVASLPAAIELDTKRIDLVIEITDGATQTEAQTRAAIARLEARGMIMSAIFIGEDDAASSGSQPPNANADQSNGAPFPSNDDQFDRLWQHRGIRIADVAALPQAISRLVNRIKLIMETRDVET